MEKNIPEDFSLTNMKLSFPMINQGKYSVNQRSVSNLQSIHHRSEYRFQITSKISMKFDRDSVRKPSAI